MKFVLIMMWVASGTPGVPVIYHLDFRTKVACQEAADQFKYAKVSYEFLRHAFCVEDK